MEVCYIAGTGRSGSTLLERLLGRIPGVVPVGEVIDLWERGVLRNELCGCGRNFHDCEFWSEVGDRAFGGWDSSRCLALHLTQRRFIRHAHPAWSTGAMPRRDRTAGAELLDGLARLYRAIGDVSGARLLVDTSKKVSYAALLDRAGISLRVVNLVRDPRAVAHSMAKVVRRPHIADGSANEYMHTRRAPVAAMEWVLFNALNQVLTAKGIPVLRVRYEDLVASPTETVHTVLDHAQCEVDLSDIGDLQRGAVDLALSHGISGNPMRFRQGPVDLQLDDAWRRDMRVADRIVTTVLTAPLLLAYGYVPASRIKRHVELLPPATAPRDRRASLRTR